MTSKYKLVRECKSTLECSILLHQVNLEFSCEACGKHITLRVSWEESEKFETESSCCQTLKINARRVSNNKDDDDKTVAMIWVSGKFKIEKRELCGKDVDWSAVFDDGSIVPLTADDKGSWNVDSVMKQLKGKEESGVNLKRKHAEVEPARDESDDDDDADRYDYGESLDDYDTAKYNLSEIECECEDEDRLRRKKDPDGDAWYDPLEFVMAGGTDYRLPFPPSQAENAERVTNNAVATNYVVKRRTEAKKEDKLSSKDQQVIIKDKGKNVVDQKSSSDRDEKLSKAKAKMDDKNSNVADDKKKSKETAAGVVDFRIFILPDV